VIVHISAVLPQ